MNTAKGTDAAAREEAKDRAAAVVTAYRDVDWKAVERGDPAAVAALRTAFEGHETTRRFLEGQPGELSDQLRAGLDRFYGEEVGPHLRNPSVLAGLGASGPMTEDELTPRRRPPVTIGHTVRMTTGCGNLYVTINETEDGRPFELFNHMGKAGGCAASQNEAIGRLISYALRCGASMEPLIKQLKGISCHRPAWSEDGKISSCSDAIGKALEKYWGAHAGPRDPAPGNGNGRPAPAPVAKPPSGGRLGDAMRLQGACPDCGGQLAYAEGCVKCHSCGFTECG